MLNQTFGSDTVALVHSQRPPQTLLSEQTHQTRAHTVQNYIKRVNTFRRYDILFRALQRPSVIT
jgi:hypothetical protein